MKDVRILVLGIGYVFAMLVAAFYVFIKNDHLESCWHLLMAVLIRIEMIQLEKQEKLK